MTKSSQVSVKVGIVGVDERGGRSTAFPLLFVCSISYGFD